MRAQCLASLGLLVFAGSSYADDLSSALLSKAPPAAASWSYDWTGVYVGGHLGYATGSSDWTATQAGAATPLAGSLDLFNGFNAFGGTGSYLLGLQAGYNHMLPSRVVFGTEADISFPNLLSGNQTISSPLIGLANYQDQVEMSGTVRGRIGYAPGNWLFYATGGFAYSFDHLTRSQIAGVAVGGTAVAGTVEDLFMVPRVGGVVGAGIEFALTRRWMARLEYLYADYGSHSVDFPAGAQRFTSDLTVQTVRVGLDYRLGRGGIDPQIFTKGPDALDLGPDNCRRGICTAVHLALYRPEKPHPESGPRDLGRDARARCQVMAGGRVLVRSEYRPGIWIECHPGRSGVPNRHRV